VILTWSNFQGTVAPLYVLRYVHYVPCICAHILSLCRTRGMLGASFQSGGGLYYCHHPMLFSMVSA
jgi:hypothetical protein